MKSAQDVHPPYFQSSCSLLLEQKHFKFKSKKSPHPWGNVRRWPLMAQRWCRHMSGTSLCPSIYSLSSIITNMHFLCCVRCFTEKGKRRRTWGYYYANFNSTKTHRTLCQRHEMLRKSTMKYCPCLKWNRDLFYLDCVHGNRDVEHTKERENC